MRHRQLPLPPRVAGIEFRQPPGNLQILPERLQRARQVPLRLQHPTHAAMRDRQLPLPTRVTRIEFRQPPGDFQTLPERHVCIRRFATRIEPIPLEAPCIGLCPGVAGVLGQFHCRFRRHPNRVRGVLAP